MAKVYFTEPTKANMWTEKAHIAWLDRIAKEQGATRQGILRQVLDGVMNFCEKTPGALTSILGYASAADTPLRARKPKGEKPDKVVEVKPAPKKRGRPRKNP